MSLYKKNNNLMIIYLKNFTQYKNKLLSIKKINKFIENKFKKKRKNLNYLRKITKI